MIRTRNLINRIVLVALSASTLASVAWGQAKYVSTPDGQASKFEKEWVGISQNLGAKLPLDAQFKDESGADVTLGQFFGKRPVVLVPVFYKCRGICMVVLDSVIKNMTSMRTRTVGKDYDVVIVSINPKETFKDAAERKQLIIDEALADKDRAPFSNGWHLLSGSQDQIDKVMTAIGFRYTIDPKVDRINHAAAIMIATPEGELSRYIYGVNYPSKMVMDAIDLAQTNHIGPKNEEILFGCVQINALTGKMNVNILRTVQLGGILTVMILIVSVILMNRASRRRERLQIPTASGGRAGV